MATGGGATLSSSTLKAVVTTAARLCHAEDALVFRLDGQELRLVVQHRSDPRHSPVATTVSVSAAHPYGRVVLERRTVHVRERSDGTGPGRRVRLVLAKPLLYEDAVVGVMVIRRALVRPLSTKQMGFLRALADQAATALENARLARELATRSRALAEALEWQTVTAVVLDALTSAATDARPVFDMIVRQATRLGEAEIGLLLGVEETGPPMLLAQHGLEPAAEEALAATSPGDAHPDTLVGRALLGGAPVLVADGAAELSRDPLHGVAGYRSAVAVPLLRGGRPVGAIALARAALRPFAGPEVDLLRTFATEATIALEHRRLVRAGEARGGALTQSA